MSTGTARFSFGTITGGCLLIVAALLLDIGRFGRQPQIEQFGNLLSALAGLFLICLPLGLRTAGILSAAKIATAGTICWGIGTAILSLVDLPAAIDPANTTPGTLLGPPGLMLLSLGFLFWFAAIHRAGSQLGGRKWLFLVSGLWFFVSFPTIQVPFFVIPGGHPLFILLSGVIGLLQVAMGFTIIERGTIA